MSNHNDICLIDTLLVNLGQNIIVFTSPAYKLYLFNDLVFK